MPVLPQDTSAKDISVAVQAKPKDSSDKPAQQEATAQDHSATPGPVLANAESLGEPASKEELKKRAEELNKGS